MKYFIGGYTWDSQSQLKRFLTEGIWENGYGTEKYSDKFNRIEVGDRFALKSTSVKGKSGHKASFLRIVKTGVVKAILSKSKIKIDWDPISNEFDLTDIKWYANTLEEITNLDDIKRIFNNSKVDQKMENIIQLLKYKHQIILQGPPGTGKTRMAKLLAKALISKNSKHTISVDDIKRHIVPGINIKTPTDYNTFNVISNNGKIIRVKPNGALNEYNVAYSEILHCLSERRFELPVTSSNKSGVGSYIVGISKFISEKLISDYYQIIQFHPSYTYEDFVRGITAKTNKEGHVHYQVEDKTLALFAQKAEDNPSSNFILIIDEINRANLPSVLGELIYALEYRYDKDKPEEISVESMYSLDEDGTEPEKSKKLKLPGNLYIIGTMNTADRSVGHIDYAIRRRFAFVEVLPKAIPELTEKGKELFYKVAALFCKEFLENKNNLVGSENIATDFNPTDVMPGHSYFLIQDKERAELKLPDDEILKLKLEFEIKPILREYKKDGILLESAGEIIESLYV